MMIPVPGCFSAVVHIVAQLYYMAKASESYGYFRCGSGPSLTSCFHNLGPSSGLALGFFFSGSGGFARSTAPGNAELPRPGDEGHSNVARTNRIATPNSNGKARQAMAETVSPNFLVDKPNSESYCPKTLGDRDGR